MVIFQNNKHIFWQALVFTIIIFSLGLLFGYFLESYRADRSGLVALNSEINLLDEQIRAELLKSTDVNCELAKASIFSFADKIYDEALQLEDYSQSSKFSSESLKTIHKKYDLLRVMLWNEGIELKKKCGDFHTVVYFFDYSSEDSETKARQSYFSRMLSDLKGAHSSDVLLIPIASNLDLGSVNLMTEFYKVKSPSILIDESKVIEDVVTLEHLESFLVS